MSIFDIFRELEQKQQSRGNLTWLVVGLGNPGPNYAQTRHNAGFLFVDALAKQWNVSVTKSKFFGLVTEATVGEQRILLVKPQTYLNESGKCVAEAAAFYKVDPTHILVAHDDVSLDVGKLRIRRQGSAGGHNGLKSIIAHLGSDAFPRLKIGVGKNQFPDLADWVLAKFPQSDLPALQETIEKAKKATELIVADKIEQAMNLYSK